ncbi:MAG: hypothetical protein LBJ86_00375, partial [Spirochaetaceae bacterium]|nr:hypothetical protein [Spirochaetaceae bacterium]
RAIGLSHIEDLVSIKDERRRARAERIVLRLAKLLILNRSRIVKGADYASMLRQAVEDESNKTDNNREGDGDRAGTN